MASFCFGVMPQVPCRAGRGGKSTASAKSPRSGRAPEGEDGLVYCSQLSRYSAQKQELCCCRGQLCRPSPAVMAREGLLLLVRGRSLCGAGEIGRPDPVSSLDQAATKSQARSLAGCPGPKTIHRFFIFQELWISRVYDSRGDSPSDFF